MPLNAVAEIARARESDVHQVQNYEVLQLRDRVLPLVRLGRAPGRGTQGGAEKIFVLVISMGERKLGLIVDSLEGEEELVIKALDDQTVATDLISGASILGDGRVVLIVNLPAIVDRHSKVRSASRRGHCLRNPALPRRPQESAREPRRRCVHERRCAYWWWTIPRSCGN